MTPQLGPKIAVPASLPRMVAATSEKGGVSKTFFCSHLIAGLRQYGVEVAAYDADSRNNSLSHAILEKDNENNPIFAFDTSDPAVMIRGSHPDAPRSALAGVVPYDLRSEEERGTFLNAVENPAANFIVHDTEGGSLTEFPKILDFGKGMVGLISEILLNVDRLIFVHPQTTDHGSCQSLLNWLDILEAEGLLGEVHNLVLLNHKFGNPAAFPWMSKSNAKNREKYNLPEFKIQALSQDLANTISEHKITTFDEVKLKKINALYSQRGQAARFSRLFMDEVRRHADVFGLVVEKEVGAAKAAPLQLTEPTAPAEVLEEVAAADEKSPKRKSA